MSSPPRQTLLYSAPQGTRWQKEKAAASDPLAYTFPQDPDMVGPWIVGECVGKGASGRVRIARHSQTGQLAAIKILPLHPTLSSRHDLATGQAKAEKQRLGIDREITMMKLMNHPNILRIYDVYEGQDELYLVLEYVKGGELFDFLVNRGRLPALEALAYFKQLIYGLNYAHAFAIIHRDLKPENILIESIDPPSIKIADWGMAAFTPPSLFLETSCGSPHYASPEIVNGVKYCGTATDIWSSGVILYALLTGRLPFDDKNVRSLLAKVKLGKFEIPPSMDPLARDLLTRMLVVDVQDRITNAEIFKHPWMKIDTPSILYTPAPCITTLARPVNSVSQIDPDVLEALMIIWGRHANVDTISLDLISPPGYGTLAKAFYCLLKEYRLQTGGHEESVEDPFSVTRAVVTKKYVAPLTLTNAAMTAKAWRVAHKTRPASTSIAESGATQQVFKPRPMSNPPAAKVQPPPSPPQKLEDSFVHVVRSEDRVPKREFHQYGPANFSFVPGDAFDNQSKENSGNKIKRNGLGLSVHKKILGSSNKEPSTTKTRRPSILTTAKTITSPSPVSPSASPFFAHTESSQIRGWISNLFTPKTNQFVLPSMQDLNQTTHEFHKVLKDLGVHVSAPPEKVSIYTPIHCWVDDIADIWTSNIVQKAVRFRVETVLSLSMEQLGPSFDDANAGPPPPPMSECAVVLIYEKGSLTTFKALSARIRMEWKLDGPRQ